MPGFYDLCDSGDELQSLLNSYHKEGLRVLIPGRLGFISQSPSELLETKAEFAYRSEVRFLTSELHCQYHPFAEDFGPVNLGVIYRFCRCLTKAMTKFPDTLIVYCIENRYESQANATFLLGAFLILKYRWSALQAAEAFTGSSAPFDIKPFRDCTNCRSYTPLNLGECFAGLEKGVSHGWFNPDDFNIQEFNELEMPHGGDIHRINPKFVAFKGPLSPESRHLIEGEIAFPVSVYAPILKRLGVTCVIRLNDSDAYDRRDFERAGIAHRDLFFTDCSVPPDDILNRFLDICDSEQRVAVHCRAGLGRTGTLIAIYMMRYQGFTADEAVAWLRIVRPGSVIGPQHAFLRQCETRNWVANRIAPGHCGGSHDHASAGAGVATRQCHAGGGGGPSAGELATQVTSNMVCRAAVKSMVKSLGAATIPHLTARCPAHGAVVAAGAADAAGGGVSVASDGGVKSRSVSPMPSRTAHMDKDARVRRRFAIF